MSQYVNKCKNLPICSIYGFGENKEIKIITFVSTATSRVRDNITEIKDIQNFLRTGEEENHVVFVQL